MPITRGNKRNRTAAFDLEEQENTLANHGDGGGHAVKSEYERRRNRLLRILKPGDHIAAKRGKGMYQHHGIYMGKEDRGYPLVIHFKGPTKSSPVCTFNCGYEPPENGGTVKSCIDCFSKSQKMYKMQYMQQGRLFSRRNSVLNHLEPGKVIAGYRSKKYYLEHKLGDEIYGHSRVSKDKLSNYTVEDRLRYYKISSDRSAEQVLEAACLSESKFRPYTYNLACQNCEHFAVFSKTGTSRSIQVEKSRLPITCENGKCATPFRNEDVRQDAENGSPNLVQEEVGSSEPVLRRSLAVKRRKTSN